MDVRCVEVCTYPFQVDNGSPPSGGFLRQKHTGAELPETEFLEVIMFFSKHQGYLLLHVLSLFLTMGDLILQGVEGRRGRLIQ